MFLNLFGCAKLFHFLSPVISQNLLLTLCAPLPYKINNLFLHLHLQFCDIILQRKERLYHCLVYIKSEKNLSIEKMVPICSLGKIRKGEPSKRAIPFCMSVLYLLRTKHQEYSNCALGLTGPLSHCSL